MVKYGPSFGWFGLLVWFDLVEVKNLELFSCFSTNSELLGEGSCVGAESLCRVRFK